MIEENITEAMMKVAAKRGKYGATREDFFSTIKGVAYGELQNLVEEMAKEGYITLDWVGSYDFVVKVTPKGMELLQNT